MAKYVYPAVFTREENGYSISFPDLENCYTSSPTLSEGLESASDVLCLTLYWMEKEERNIPSPSEISGIQCGHNEFASLVSCDTDWYRRFYEGKSVKKTLTIPGWLNDLAERKGINFSGLLQKALKKELGLAD